MRDDIDPRTWPLPPPALHTHKQPAHNTTTEHLSARNVLATGPHQTTQLFGATDVMQLSDFFDTHTHTSRLGRSIANKTLLI